MASVHFRKLTREELLGAVAAAAPLAVFLHLDPHHHPVVLKPDLLNAQAFALTLKDTVLKVPDESVVPGREAELDQCQGVSRESALAVDGSEQPGLEVWLQFDMWAGHPALVEVSCAHDIVLGVQGEGEAVQGARNGMEVAKGEGSIAIVDLAVRG